LVVISEVLAALFLRKRCSIALLKSFLKMQDKSENYSKTFSQKNNHKSRVNE